MSQELDAKIINWAKERGIFDNANPVAQCSKTVEEVAETLNAVIKHDAEGIVDGIGDVYVTLVLLARMFGKTVEECGEIAYREIANRKGKMINCMFVKEA